MNPEQLLADLDSGRTSLGQLRGLGPVQLEMLYTMGHSLYRRGEIDDAADVFSLLTIYEPSEPRFWFALGAANQERRRLEEAMTSYAFAALLDGQNAWPLVHLAECLLLEGDHERAREALQRAIVRAESQGDDAAKTRAIDFIRYEEVSHVR